MRYFAERLLSTIPVLLGVSLLVFLLVHAIPGDPARNIAGERASAEVLDRIRKAHGLDQSLPVQYLRFMGRLVIGDMGTSIQTGEPVSSEIARRFPATIELALAAVVLATLLGVPIGIAASLRPNSAVDLGSMSLALVGVSIPVFCLGYLLIVLVGDHLPFAGRLQESTLQAFQPRTGFYLVESLVRFEFGVFGDALRHLALPALALSSVPLAVVARITRSAMLEVLGQDYIKTARAKGLAERVVVLKHALRNACVPILTILGVQTGYLLGGAVLTETVFSWPGLGQFVVSSIGERDYPLIQGGVLLFACTFVATNLVVDMLYTRLDPRVKYGDA